MGVTAVDYDDDGTLDLFVTGYEGNVLYRGTGPCRFQDVTEKASLRGGGFATGPAWADYDRDGDLDLFVARYVHVDLNNLPEFGSSAKTCTYRGIRVQCGPRGLPGETDFFYRNKGDGTFEEVARKVGVADERKHYGMAGIFGDYDDDGWPDLFVANDATYNYLYRNRRDGTFEETGAVAGVAYGESGAEQGSMGVTWGDFDSDGRLDLFVSNFENEPNALYKNLGATGFVDVTRTSKIGHTSLPYVGWGTAFTDFDNDGFADLLVANGHVYPQIELAQGKYPTGYRQHFLLFRNLGTGAFEEVSEAAGLRGLPLALAARRGLRRHGRRRTRGRRGRQPRRAADRAAQHDRQPQPERHAQARPDEGQPRRRRRARHTAHVEAHAATGGAGGRELPFAERPASALRPRAGREDRARRGALERRRDGDNLGRRARTDSDRHARERRHRFGRVSGAAQMTSAPVHFLMRSKNSP